LQRDDWGGGGARGGKSPESPKPALSEKGVAQRGTTARSKNDVNGQAKDEDGGNPVPLAELPWGAKPSLYDITKLKRDEKDREKATPAEVEGVKLQETFPWNGRGGGGHGGLEGNSPYGTKNR